MVTDIYLIDPVKDDFVVEITGGFLQRSRLGTDEFIKDEKQLLLNF